MGAHRAECAGAHAHRGAEVSIRRADAAGLPRRLCRRSDFHPGREWTEPEAERLYGWLGLRLQKQAVGTAFSARPPCLVGADPWVCPYLCFLEAPCRYARRTAGMELTSS